MVFNREEAAKRAEAARTNDVGMCQLWTRTMFGAPSAGDRDLDGDADAVDGWKSEPTSARHPGDRNPPRGVPVSWSGGRNGHGHRAVSLGGGMVRSTDAPSAGLVGTVDLGWFERHWGLTYLGWSETITGIVIPKPPAPAPAPLPEVQPDHRRLHVMHASLQVQDTADQIKSDIEKIFTRAQNRKVAWITGTEAFGPKVMRPLEAAGFDHGFRVERPAGQDSWVAVRKSLIAGNFRVHWEKIVEGGEVHRDLGVLGVEFDTDNMGDFTVIANHLLTARQPNAAEKNLRVTRAVGRYAEVRGKGSNKVFYGADQNLRDRNIDTFSGIPFTSVQDELRKYEPTHEHGGSNIDVIATYDPDKNVKAVYVRSLNDTEFKLYGDHFVVEAGLDVALVN